MERNRIIVITPQERDYLMKVFDCSAVSVYEAVKYRKHNPLHKRIRMAAIKRGNPQMVLAPEFDTIFLENREDVDETMTRYMVQTFSNGATIEGNLTTGLVVIRDRRGEIQGEWISPKLTELAAIQEVAQSL